MAQFSLHGLSVGHDIKNWSNNAIIFFSSSSFSLPTLSGFCKHSRNGRVDRESGGAGL